MSTRRRFAPAALLFVVAGAAFAQAPAPVPPPAPSSTPSKVTNDAFSITLPAGYTAFTNQTKSADSPEGKVDTTTWVAKSTAGQAVIVAMTKMPGRILDPDKMIGSTRDALVKSLNATVENEEKLPGDLKAENLLFKSNSAPIFARARLIVAGDRQYQLIFIGHADAERTDPAVGAMFDSFQATAQTSTTTPAATSTTTTTTNTTVATSTAPATTTTNPKQ
jgi:hypothetical protein